ncbi:MAG: SMP-30/gluconolactonase/LRE family protein [Eubacteriales bacterium]
MQNSKLLVKLPDYVCTPDGMAVDGDGSLVLACPNFADFSKPGCVLKIDKDLNITKWFDVPVSAQTGRAFPMGIAFGPDGDLYICDNQGWSGREELKFKGRLLRVRVRDSMVVKVTEIARGMEHPNGVRIQDGYAYVTQSMLEKVSHPSGKLVSCVYRFALDEEGVEVSNTLEDKNLLTTFVTYNPDCQYGADGIEFDSRGDMYVGNFGDGAVYRVSFNEDMSVMENIVWAQCSEELKSTDGMVMDSSGNLYIADFCANAVVRVTPEGVVSRVAQSPDTDGLNGELDQPGDLVIWNGKLIVSCFDLVTGPGKVNTAHELPATLAWLEI